jgi:hypothetical protein
LAELGIELRHASRPIFTYVPWVQTDREAAHIVGLNMLANIRAALGWLDCFERVVKTLGTVNSAPDLDPHPKVIYGFSDRFVQDFGEARARRARRSVWPRCRCRSRWKSRRSSR